MNLIRATRKKIITTGRRKKLNKDSIWLISTEKNNKKYFVYEVDTNSNSITWTPTLTEGMMFHLESGAQQFVREFIKKDRSNEMFIYCAKDPDQH